MPLTDTQIKATAHDPTRRITLTDGNGLQLRLSKQNKRSWSFQYRYKNSNKKLTLGQWPSVNCKKARTLANEARYQIARGIDPQSARRKAKEIKQRLRDVWSLYDQMHIENNVKEKTAKDYRLNAIRNILPSLGKLYLDEIEKKVIVQLVDSIAARAPIMANRTLGLLKHFFDWCVGRGHLNFNPASGIPKPAKEMPRGRILSLSEMRKLYQAADLLSEGNQLFLKLLLLTGQRAGVIAKLTVKELKSDYLEIDGRRNKSGSRIVVPLPKVAQTQVEELGYLDGPYIVSNTAGMKPISGFSKLKKKVDALSGISDWRFHDIRRGMATHLEDIGVDRFYVERVLTHKDRSVTGIYARSKHLEVRAQLLEQWALILSAEDGASADNIISFKGGVA